MRWCLICIYDFIRYNLFLLKRISSWIASHKNFVLEKFMLQIKTEIIGQDPLPMQLWLWKFNVYPQLTFLFRVNNRNTRKWCDEMCSKLTIKTPKRRQWRCFGVFISNFEHILHLFQMFLLLTSNKLGLLENRISTMDIIILFFWS